MPSRPAKGTQGHEGAGTFAPGKGSTRRHRARDLIDEASLSSADVPGEVGSRSKRWRTRWPVLFRGRQAPCFDGDRGCIGSFRR